MSVVSLAEVTGGMRSPERRDVWRLLGTMRKQPVDELTARRAGEFMRRHRRSREGIGLGDYLVAAPADLRGLELATLDVEHFPTFKGLRPPFRLP